MLVEVINNGDNSRPYRPTVIVAVLEVELNTLPVTFDGTRFLIKK